MKATTLQYNRLLIWFYLYFKNNNGCFFYLFIYIQTKPTWSMLTPPQVATLLKKFSLASVCKCPPCMPALCLRPYRMRVWFKRKFRRWFDNFVTGQVKITYETSPTFTRNFPALGMHASSTCLLVHLILILLH